MRIGMVTFHNAFNYGAVLQAYALQFYLSKIGHCPFIINCDYKLDGPLTKHRHRRGVRSVGSSFMAMIRKKIIASVFRDFKKKHLKMDTYKYSGYMEIQGKPPSADAYICGSDQIWHPNHFNSRDERAIWLDFGADHIRRISYAASFGVSELDTPIRSRWSAFAKRFTAISVREKEGINLVNNLGRSDAKWVPDPVLLIPPSDYESITIHSESYRIPSIFSYQVAAEWEQFEKAKAIVRKIINVPFCDCRTFSIKHNISHGGRVSVEGWITRMQYAKFVITSSFHGAAYSILFHRPFVVLLRSSGHPGIARLNSLLNLVNLQHRIVSPFDESKIVHLCHDEVDWSHVDKKIAEYKHMGVQFLDSALSC